MLEISEKYAIENYTLFVEALQNFTDMGFEVAVDDIGAGYSGLEKIAHLNPRYLKFDMQLVKDIDHSHVRREMTRAVKNFAARRTRRSSPRASSARASSRRASRSGSSTARATCSAAPPRSRRSTSGRRRLLPLADEARGLEPRRQVRLGARAVGR